jgi:hypothetical protein
VVGTILMTAIAMIGLTVRARAKRYRLAWDAAAMIAVHLLCMTLLAR